MVKKTNKPKNTLPAIKFCKLEQNVTEIPVARLITFFLPDMSKQLQVKDKIEFERIIKVAPFKKDIRRTTPHKHNSYFEIIYLSQGKGIHAIDSRTYPVTPPVVYIVRKEQVHHWELENEPDGFVLILKKTFIDNSLDRELKELLSQVSAFTCIYLKDEGTIGQLFALLVQEYQPEQSNNTPVMEGLLKALLAKILQMAKPVQWKKRTKNNLFLDFQELLSENKTLKNNVAHYAGLLNTTPQNLNAICRRTANQSATEVLAECIISEAKRLLLYTDMTAAEISLSLDFKDNSHFIKYFKRHTGHTPQSFRSLV
jgi:AraC family transcriptional activator of pobA